MSEEQDRERRAAMAKGIFQRHRSRSGAPLGNYRGGFAIRRPRTENGSETSVDSRGSSGTDSGGESSDLTQQRQWTPPPGVYRSKTGTGKSRWDPQDIGTILQVETTRRGWDHTLSVASVSADWHLIVGPQVAQHCPIDSFEGGVLVAQADSTAWAEQLRLLLPHIQRRIDERVGSGVVHKVIVKAPQAPSWVHGARHIPGRGPRDTYG